MAENANYRNVGDSIDFLKKEGTISEKTAQALKDGNREVEVPDMDDVYSDPVFSCFLFDNSGSMEPYQEAVINSHPVLLDTLRDSAKCKNDALYVIQCLFNSFPKELHSAELLDQHGNDQVISLNSSNFNPSGMTALYKALFQVLQNMATIISYSEQEHQLKSTFTIGVITDGENNKPGPDPSVIKDFLDEMRNKGHLRSSVILGLTNNELTDDCLNDIKERLGFDQAISLSQSERTIRRAFVLASQSAISGQ